ncbi:phosphoglycerate mutase-like protein [Biscogniauxia mediterranea]|nr:phosphoglycerate mutase-like protein [Biscogniauxia mediterranea]
MAPTIHIVRHAEGWHNLPGNHNVRDPILTPLGRLQCANLLTNFPHMDEVAVLLASPMRRTISTCLLAFLPVSESNLPKYEKRVTLLPDIQEVGAWNCDIGSEIETIEAEFGERVDTSLVEPDWNVKNHTTEWAVDVAKIEIRAQKARWILRSIAYDLRDTNAHIVAVTHGMFAHWLTQDFGGIGANGLGWRNAEYRSYQFVDLEGTDDEAMIVEMSASIQRRNGLDFWKMSLAERARLKNIAATIITSWANM